jgi:Ca2+-binding EF-hand superfamily protein
MKKVTGSNVQGNSRMASSSFKFTEFERPGVSNDEIREIKEVFDLFDSHRTGIIRSRGTFNITQTSSNP